MEKIVTQYLRNEKVKIPRKYIEKAILSHPDYPAIISIADTFNLIGLDYVVARKSQAELSKMEFPFLIHINTSSLKAITSKSDIKRNRELISKKWSGIIIKVDRNSEIKSRIVEKYKKETGFKVILNVGIILLFMSGLISLYDSFSFWQLFWLTSSVVGLLVGMILFGRELGITNESIEKFCRASEKTDCDQVLSSKFSTLIFGIKLSDLVVGYFAFQAFFLINHSFDQVSSVFHYYALVSPILAGFSIYSQYVVVKKWCKLCLIITLLLTVQFIISVAYTLHINNLVLDIHLFVFSIFSIGTLISIASIVRRLGEEMVSERSLNILAKRIVSLPEVFKGVLVRSQTVSKIDFSQKFGFGNQNARNSIYLNLKLGCEPCKETFEKLCETFELYSEKVFITINFAPSTKMENDISDSEYLLQYWFEKTRNRHYDNQMLITVLLDWYRLMDITAFKKKYPLKDSKVSKEVLLLIEEQSTWLQQNSVNRFPTVYFNQKMVPPNYRMDLLATSLPHILAENESIGVSAES